MAEIILLTGRAAPLPGSDQKSGIDKRPVGRPLMLGSEGFEGDEQADRRVHGGPEKAVHHYPYDHYAAWRADFGLAKPGVSHPRTPVEYLRQDEMTKGRVNLCPLSHST